MRITAASARSVFIPLMVAVWAGAFVMAGPAGAAEETTTAEPFERRSYRDQLGGQLQSRSSTDGSGSVMPYQPYTDWSWPGQGYTSTSQTLTIDAADPGSHYFWAYDFSVGGDGVGYAGLQTGAYPANNKIALFAIWGADAAQGPGCGPFANEGLGWTCRIDPFEWTAGRPYVLRVSVESIISQGTWYKATIRDVASGQEWTIGRIRHPSPRGRLVGRGSWTEWFGYPAESCDRLKRSRVRWGMPTAQDGAVSTTSHTNRAEPKDGSTACKGSAAAVDDQSGVSQRVGPK